MIITRQSGYSSAESKEGWPGDLLSLFKSSLEFLLPIHKPSLITYRATTSRDKLNGYSLVVAESKNGKGIL